MISVVIPTRDSERTLAPTLAALIPAAVDGFVREVIVVDGGSKDRTLVVAENAGVEVVETTAGRGHRLRTGARRARFPWLLFLHAGTELAPGWETAAANFMQKVDSERIPASAAAFRIRLTDEGWTPRLIEAAVGLRCAVLRLTTGDQGLLIPAALYEQIGGFSDQSSMEDIDIVRRLGRARLRLLAADAVNGSAAAGDRRWTGQTLRQELCLALCAAGIAPDRMAWMFGSARTNPAPVDARQHPTSP
jgi:glycosyltransferase involved in cell wall biosynthesis